MLAGSRWSTTALTVGAGLELRGGAFPQEEGQAALGGEKKHKTHINSLKYLYQKWINIFFIFACDLKLTMKSRSGAGVGVGTWGLTWGVRG